MLAMAHSGIPFLKRPPEGLSVGAWVDRWNVLLVEWTDGTTVLDASRKLASFGNETVLVLGGHRPHH